MTIDRSFFRGAQISQEAKKVLEYLSDQAEAGADVNLDYINGALLHEGEKQTLRALAASLTAKTAINAALLRIGQQASYDLVRMAELVGAQITPDVTAPASVSAVVAVWGPAKAAGASLITGSFTETNTPVTVQARTTGNVAIPETLLRTLSVGASSFVIVVGTDLAAARTYFASPVNVRVYVTDAAGNEDYTQVSVFYDGVAPVLAKNADATFDETKVAGDAVATGALTEAHGPVTSWTLTSGADDLIALNYLTAVDNGDNTYSIKLGSATIGTIRTYLTGGKSVVIRCTDPAGNVSNTQTHTLTYAHSIDGWNANDKSAGVTINGFLATAPNDSNFSGVRGSRSHTTGKFYFELKAGLTTQGDWAGGLATDAAAFNAGFNTAGFFVVRANGEVYSDTSYTPTTLSISNNDVMMIAVDFDAGKIFYGKNGSWADSADPAAGTGNQGSFTPNTALFPAGETGNNAGAPSWTLQAYSADKSYAPPTGYSMWST